MIAPVFWEARVVAASTTSSITSSVFRAENAPSSGVLPRWASTFRISAWNTTISPNSRMIDGHVVGANVLASHGMFSSCPIVGGSSSTAAAKMTGITPAMFTRSGM